VSNCPDLTREHAYDLIVSELESSEAQFDPANLRIVLWRPLPDGSGLLVGADVEARAGAGNPLASAVSYTWDQALAQRAEGCWKLDLVDRASGNLVAPEIPCRPVPTAGGAVASKGSTWPWVLGAVGVVAVVGLAARGRRRG
jgi:hypothetical protein